MIAKCPYFDMMTKAEAVASAFNPFEQIGFCLIVFCFIPFSFTSLR